MTETLRGLLRALTVLTVVVLLTAAARAAEAPASRAYPEGDRLFHTDPRWLGGDAAFSVALSSGRTLWLFGDSFVDETAPYARTDAAFVRNTVAIETGTDPRRAGMHFYWRHDKRGKPTAFVPGATDSWYWPRGGVRLKAGPLILFLSKIKPAANDLGFATVGYAIARVANPSEEPAQWRMRVFDQPRLPFDALPGSGPVLDGGFVVTLATRERDAHAASLVRYRISSLEKRRLIPGRWWEGKTRSWVSIARVAAVGPTIVIGDAGAESSLHWSGTLRSYVHVASYGFGASTIGVRTAPKLTGPWSAVRTVYRPPESDAPKPFVYAGKAHPEQTGAPGLLVTYVANAFDPASLLTPDGERKLYWPHFAVVPIEKIQE
ncbi:MAG: DUF4185 domain-containing protein [Alphaproteobacteria bacterium]|nr:DUF4185 domain-containing protein [Alphaproteobacteria bacterium]